MIAQSPRNNNLTWTIVLAWIAVGGLTAACNVVLKYFGSLAFLEGEGVPQFGVAFCIASLLFILFAPRVLEWLVLRRLCTRLSLSAWIGAMIASGATWVFGSFFLSGLKHQKIAPTLVELIIWPANNLTFSWLDAKRDGTVTFAEILSLPLAGYVLATAFVTVATSASPIFLLARRLGTPVAALMTAAIVAAFVADATLECFRPMFYRHQIDHTIFDSWRSIQNAFVPAIASGIVWAATSALLYVLLAPHAPNSLRGTRQPAS